MPQPLDVVGIPAISAVLNVLFDKVADELLNYVRNRTTEIIEPCTLRVKLRTTMLALSVVLDHANARHISNPAVLEWLQELSDVMYNAEALEDDFRTEALRLKAMAESTMLLAPNNDHDQVPTTLPSTHPLMTKKLVAFCEKLDVFLPQINLISLGGSLDLEKRRSPISLLMPASLISHEPIIVGRNSEREELVTFLVGRKDDGISNNRNASMCVVAIVGDPGLGRTALARTVFDDPRVKDLFDFHAWVSISSPTMMSTDWITKATFKSVTKTNAPDDHFKALQAKLSMALLGKSLLLVLDDILDMEENFWNELFCPLRRGAKCVVVIVITSNDVIASRISPAHGIQMSPLSDEDCFDVLKSAANIGDNVELIEHGAREEIGKQIAVKCKGSPLAARVLGGSLRFMLNVEDWDATLKNEVWDLPNDKFSIPPALRLSYSYLPPLKRCFAYCSIFPKNYEIERERLVLLWIAEGFIQVLESDTCSLEEVGDRYFSELLCRSFFQPSSSNTTCFVMHSLVHDLAQYASSHFCFTLDKRNPQLLPSKNRHFSYFQTKHGDFKFLKDMDGHVHFEKLRTFLPLRLSCMNCCDLDDEEAKGLLPKFTSLRVLSLAFYSIEKLPECLGALKHHRFLDLSRTFIKNLPKTVCTMYHLQTLLLCDCLLLTTLPEQLGDLLSLHHLVISGATKLQNMPLQISKLNKISTLTNFVVGKNRGAKISALRDFHNLIGHLTISGLQNVVSESDSSNAKMKTKMYLDELTLEWGGQSQSSQKEKRVCHLLRPSTKLKRITIKSYSGTSFPDWVGAHAFAEIVCVNLTDCRYCTCLPPLGQLPSLKQLHITNFFALETMGSEFYGNIEPFPALEILRMENMHEWKMWSPYQGNGDAFPRLQELYLYTCPKMSGHLPTKLPSLLKLEIKNCGHLCGLIPQFPAISKLGLEECPKLDLMSIAGLTTLVSLDIRITSSETQFDEWDLQRLTSLLELKMEYSNKTKGKMILADDNNSSIKHEAGMQTMLISDSLRDLTIHSCAFHMVCPATSLRSLNIVSHSKTLKFNIRTYFSSLQSLDLSHCDSLDSFSFQLFPMLIHLKIARCSRLKVISIPQGLELQCLYQFSITSCKQLLHFPGQGLPAPNLTTFSIINCERLKYLPGEMRSLLPSLRLLSIEQCEVLKPFPGGGWPPNLCAFRIRSCKTPMATASEWGAQLPASLTEPDFDWPPSQSETSYIPIEG